ncbi:MAG: hypothetical protein WC091_23195 [Sulfuricellaceae bacterium]
MAMIAFAALIVETYHARALLKINKPVFVGVFGRRHGVGHFPDYHPYHRAVIEILLKAINQLSFHLEHASRKNIFYALQYTEVIK